MTDSNPIDIEAKRQEKARAAGSHAAPTTGDDGDDPRPVIHIQGGELPAIVDAGEDALIEAAAELYQSGGRLVAIGHTDPTRRREHIRRADGAPRLVPATAVHVRELLTAAAIWKRFDARSGDWRAIDCPMNVAAAFVDRGRWHLRELVAYVEAPTVRDDGSPVTEPGYDDRTGLYLLPGAPRVQLPATPTHADARACAEQLRDALASWPYIDGADSADHAAAVATVIGMLYARSIDAVPMACVTAPTPGTGKSLLIDAGSIIATGRRAAVVSLGRDPAEAGKRLAAGLLAGDSPLAADNVETALGDELLCQAVTQPWMSIRPLGTSTPVRVPTRTALCATGNNLTIRGDLTRRVMMIRLDAGMERPETRQFTGNILAELCGRRSELIAAAITITTAYHAAGCPAVDIDPLGGFDAWDRLIRRPLVWAGLHDPLEPTAEVRAEDPDRAAMVALFLAVKEQYGDRIATAADIIEDAARVCPRYNGDGFTPDYPALHDAVRQVCGSRVDARQLGVALRRYRGRIAEGLRLDGIPRHGPSKVTGWQIVLVQPALPSS